MKTQDCGHPVSCGKAKDTLPHLRRKMAEIDACISNANEAYHIIMHKVNEWFEICGTVSSSTIINPTQFRFHRQVFQKDTILNHES
jgi:hypothetical protein